MCSEKAQAGSSEATTTAVVVGAVDPLVGIVPLGKAAYKSCSGKHFVFPKVVT